MSNVTRLRTKGAALDEAMADLEWRLTLTLDVRSLRDVRFASSAECSVFSPSPGDVCLLDPTAAAMTVELPDPATCVGRWILLKEDAGSANPITVRSPSRVGGGDALILSTPRRAVSLLAGAAGWRAF